MGEVILQWGLETFGLEESPFGDTLKKTQFQPLQRCFELLGAKCFRRGGRFLQGLDPSGWLPSFLGPRSSSPSAGNALGARELCLGAQQNDVWTDRITSLLLVCEARTLRGTFITPSSISEEGEGNSRREKQVEGRRGRTQTREEVVWGAFFPA